MFYAKALSDSLYYTQGERCRKPAIRKVLSPFHISHFTIDTLGTEAPG